MTDANERRTMKEIDHTHPYDDRSAGDLFLRGPVVVADGGERAAGSRTSKGERSESSGSERNAVSRSSSERDSDGGERERSERDPRRTAPRSDGGERDAVDVGAEESGAEPASGTMKDVDHTPPESEEGANRVFERGEEHGTEPIVGEE